MQIPPIKSRGLRCREIRIHSAVYVNTSNPRKLQKASFFLNMKKAEHRSPASFVQLLLKSVGVRDGLTSLKFYFPETSVLSSQIDAKRKRLGWTQSSAININKFASKLQL